ncbi:MAG: hypothetical protein EB076_09575, partial [Flavobacteriia bacterium]|nr:hypothetical protein [Flavobacteriia bacterium]
ASPWPTSRRELRLPPLFFVDKLFKLTLPRNTLQINDLQRPTPRKPLIINALYQNAQQRPCHNFFLFFLKKILAYKSIWVIL